jgi:hypothetical protein
MTMITGNLHLYGIVTHAIPVTLVTVIWSLPVPWPVVVSPSVLAMPRSPVTLPNMPFLPSNQDTLQVNPNIMEQRESPGLSMVAIPRLPQLSAGSHNPEATVNPDIPQGRHRRCLSQYQLLMTQGQEI